MSIYTRTGDTGETSLFGGKRVLKNTQLVEVYGSIDELNCWVGLVTAHIADPAFKNFLQDIQADLLTIGGTLAGWKGDVKNLEVCAEDMEVWIDEMEKYLPELHSFILPGGSIPGAHTHIARTVCRKVERGVVDLFHNQPDKFHLSKSEIQEIIKYLNRLSDLFFMLARFINKGENVREKTWKGIK